MDRKKILMIDKADFSYRDLERKPLGGTMHGFISLVRAFEELGHHITVRTKAQEPFDSANVEWRNLNQAIPKEHYDLFIVNRIPKLFDYYPKASNKVLWMRNTGKYLFRPGSIIKILKHWPKFAFTSQYHKKTYPFFMPGGKRFIIPHGLDQALITRNISETTSLKVAFTSNPLRGLSWLADLWIKHIHPAVPDAELHVFVSHTTYGAWGETVKHLMDPIIEKIKKASAHKIVLRDALPKEQLFKEISTHRGMFYRGDAAETFCFAIAEALALGLPCVVQDLGCMRERVIHGKTGFIEDNDVEFAKQCIAILKDDSLFRTLRKNAIESSKDLSWENTAKQFLRIK
jgi:glycosyltransferase involved in cell wall biosynthesis